MQKGQAAPSFSLYDTERNKISLSDFKGKPVVILFFPLAFTGVCTTELCGIRDDIANYNALGAQVIGISVDSTATLNQFKKEQQFNFPLLSDFNKDVSKAYDCFYEEYFFEMKGVSRRGAFVIDGNGIIQYREVLESAGDLPHFEAIKSVLSELKK